jgi:hypothetical protein
MTSKDYGKLKPLYVATDIVGDRLQVLVCHDNDDVHAVLSRHQRHPHWFYDHYGTWITSKIKAKYWLASLVSEFSDYFESDRVNFIWPTAPLPLAPVPIQAIDPSEAAWERDLVLVIERSTEIEAMLVRRLRARGCGLGALMASVEHKLPLVLGAELRDVASQRNPIAHPFDKQTGERIVPKPRLRSREQFCALCDAVLDALSKLAA